MVIMVPYPFEIQLGPLTQGPSPDYITGAWGHTTVGPKGKAVKIDYNAYLLFDRAATPNWGAKYRACQAGSCSPWRGGTGATIARSYASMWIGDALVSVLSYSTEKMTGTVSIPLLCSILALANINFPTSVPAIEDLKGTLTLKNPDSAKGVGRVRAINRDTGEMMATTGEVELSAGQEAPIEFSMKMIYNILNLKLVAESLCLDKWNTDFTKDISISPLFAKTTIGNLNFPVGQTHGEKFSISFDLINVGAHGLGRLRILDMDTNKEVFSTGTTELQSSKAFTYSGTMPTIPLNLRLVAESVKTDKVWYEDTHTDISLKSLCREGAIKVIDFLQGRVITEICKAGEWVENLPPTLKIIDITTPSFSKLGELFKVEVKCRNEGGMGASMVADQQFDILGGETKTVAYTLKMPVVDEHLFKIDARSLHNDGKWHTDDTKERGVRARDALISEIGTGKLTMATGSKSVSFKVAVRGREVEILGKKIPFGVTEVVVGKIAPYSSFDIEGKGIHYIRTRTTLPLVLAEDRKIIGEGRDYVFSSFKRPFTYMASKTKAVFRG